MADTKDATSFAPLFSFLEQHLWQPITLTVAQQLEFDQACRLMYFTKTQERVKQFLRYNPDCESHDYINGCHVSSIESLLELVDWENLVQGIPSLFHGDLQPENILIANNAFYLIDWREDFGGIQPYGDRYYDFAKLYHALIITHEMVRRQEFNVEASPHGVRYSFAARPNLLRCKRFFEQYLTTHAYDLSKVQLLTALTYLNIAALHHEPYNHLLYYAGKHYLQQLLTQQSSEEIQWLPLLTL